MSLPCITLTTDFGVQDGYVAAMKGVLLSRAPGVRLIDVSHAIPPGDIDAAAHVLRQAAPQFPAETVHLVVIDPGVGSARRAIACAVGGQVYVAPDNGVLTAVLPPGAELRVHAIERAELWAKDPSPVFHGRDIFAPVAAFLARGGSLEAVGGQLDPATLVRTFRAAVRIEGDLCTGEVIHVDRFGNLVTNIPLPAGSAEAARVEVAGRELPLARTYSDVGDGEVVALYGSSGLLEIACNRGDAAQVLGAARGAVVTLRVHRRR